jgi:hypothetical protein
MGRFAFGDNTKPVLKEDGTPAPLKEVVKQVGVWNLALWAKDKKAK